MLSFYKPFFYLAKPAYVLNGLLVRVIIKYLLLFYNLLLLFLYICYALLVQASVVQAYSLSHNASYIIHGEALKGFIQYRSCRGVPFLRNELSKCLYDHLLNLIIIRKGELNYYNIFFQFRRYLCKCRRKYANSIYWAVLVNNSRNVPELS